MDISIKLLVSITPKISEYVKTLKFQDRDKDKKNKLMFFRTDNEKLLEKYKVIWTRIGNLRNKLYALLVYGDR